MIIHACSRYNFNYCIINQYYSSIMFVSKKFFIKPSHFKKSKKRMILIN